MTRIATPTTIADAPETSRPVLEAVAKQAGKAPNMVRSMAISPQALEGHLGLFASRGKEALPGSTRERIALAVAEVNGCSYCLSARAHLCRNLAKLDDAELAASRNCTSQEPKADAAVRFAATVARTRGHITDADAAAVKIAGYSDAQIIEIVQHVALDTWTNYFNEVFQTDIDFPVVEARMAA